MLFNHSKTQTSLNRPVVINLFSIYTNTIVLVLINLKLTNVLFRIKMVSVNMSIRKLAL